MGIGLYTITTRAVGLVLTAAIYNSDHQNHVNSQNPEETCGYSDNVATMQANSDPGEVGTESLAASLATEIEHLRFAILEIKKGLAVTDPTYWYETISDIDASKLNITSAAQGDVLFRGASAFQRLAAGTAGQFLRSGGAGADVSWGLVPTGMIVPYGGTTAPGGALMCDGSAVSRTTYANLFAVIGTTYGTGDGSTTFNVPDLRGRTVAGKDDMGGSAANRLTSGGSGITGTTLGASGGEETHQLTSAEMPSHTHVLSGNSASGNNDSMVTVGANTSRGSNTDNTLSAGSDGAHNNVQPTLVLNWIIGT